ncbi:amidohydrolase [Peterkaempfera bronchialis]|uniref:Amidohydrolase n=1 Tax=Peterkaempfera bronchialis TaxID=2126346 RepID=A0A345T359_9ACTN|nr:amidohydrolase [Peterkaempfera bronchialis]AXI80414.1 amidohydrolase [Peterkaempfera bronchialis]
MRADTLFTGGPIHTGDPGNPLTDALAVAAGRITALGADALAQRDTGTEVVDLAGGALLPSWGDGHIHPLMGGLGLSGVPVRDCTTLDQVVEAVRRWAAEHPEAEWIRGDAFDPWLAEGGLFDARLLDAVVPDRPVLLRTMDHHTGWANSEALRRADYTADTPDPAHGEIVRRADGTPLGTLREFGALDPLLALVPAPDLDRQLAALAEVTSLLAAAGLTWVQDAWVESGQVAAWTTAARQGLLRVRADLALLLGPDGWRDRLPALAEDRDRIEADGAGRLTARSVKFFADGVIESGTAALLEPYTDCPHSHGAANWTGADLADAVTAVDALGFRPHIHAIGDRGVRLALDALEAAARRNGPRDRRPVIAHVQLVDPADLPRFAELGVIANFEPLWAQTDPLMTELTLPRIGDLRGSRQYQIAALLRSGARVSFGSDWPVTPYPPLAGLATAVTRQTPDGLPADGWVPEERIGLADALAAYSAGVAHQAFEDDQWGVLRPGMRADLVHLAADPYRVPPLELPGTPVLGTWLGGVRTHGPAAAAPGC